MARICVVDDAELMRDSLSSALARENHAVDSFADPTEALSALKSRSYEVLITDLKMPKLDGVGLLRELRGSGVEVPVILMTAFATVKTAVEAMKLGAFDYVQKPFEMDEICLLVDRALSMRKLRSENEALRASLHDWDAGKRLVGASGVMTDLLDKLGRVAQSHQTVLIHGESGTGKEMIARRIHAESPRAEEPMLCLNCAALSSQLLESELFGHEKGSFTGADRLRKGRFELADGGTLLLDEISELPLSLQPKLLRVLQEHEFERVGSSVTRTSDVRVIATTNRDLPKWVAEEKFREDLYYRLSVLPLCVEPLRNRKSDIPGLVEYFMERIAQRDGRPVLRVDRGAMKLLTDYDWPGNVRELENVCERASVLVVDGVIRSESLEGWLRGTMKTAYAMRNLRPGHLLEDMERHMIEETLARFNGHREKSAKALGMGVRTLGMKLKKWREEAREAG